MDSFKLTTLYYKRVLKFKTRIGRYSFVFKELRLLYFGGLFPH